MNRRRKAARMPGGAESGREACEPMTWAGAGRGRLAWRRLRRRPRPHPDRGRPPSPPGRPGWVGVGREAARRRPLSWSGRRPRHLQRGQAPPRRRFAARPRPRPTTCARVRRGALHRARRRRGGQRAFLTAGRRRRCLRLPWITRVRAWGVTTSGSGGGGSSGGRLRAAAAAAATARPPPSGRG